MHRGSGVSKGRTLLKETARNRGSPKNNLGWGGEEANKNEQKKKPEKKFFQQHKKANPQKHRKNGRTRIK